mgnify:CR=1 FL=1
MFLGNPLYYYLYYCLYYNALIVVAVATRWGTVEPDVVANAYIMPTSCLHPGVSSGAPHVRTHVAGFN